VVKRLPRNGSNNLIPADKRSKEEARELGRKGGLASGEARKNKKLIRDLLPEFLQAEMTDNQKRAIQKAVPIMGKDKSMQAAIVAGQVYSAIQGNTKAFEAITEMQNKAQNTKDDSKWTMPVADVTKDFVDVYREMHKAFKTGCWQEFVLKGGRGSIKSSFMSEFALETIKNDNQAHVVFTRRYKTDLRGSVYTQFLKTVTRLDMLDEWEFTTSPMMAKYKKTGQCVIFVGCDKPISLKSYNLPFGYVKLMVNEECDEMAGIEQLDNVEDTFLRQDVNAISVKVFNPPKSANNWMNEYAAKPKPTCYVNHSFYYNTPIDWLGKRFFERAEWFKNNKPRYYENNYLGKVTGTGGGIFENIEIRTITGEELSTLGEFYHGLDFGWEHPQAFTQCAFNRETDTLYITAEVVKKHCKQMQFARKIAEYKNVETIADSANPEYISEYNDYGFDMIGAIKGWGSRSYAWEWLQMRRKIVIDEERTPNAAKEFSTLEFELLKDGTFSSAYPTIGEDSIMSVAYALNRVMREEKRMSQYEDYDEEDEFDD
jgi:PBSX family phage terminase large subunit